MRALDRDVVGLNLGLNQDRTAHPLCRQARREDQSRIKVDHDKTRAQGQSMGALDTKRSRTVRKAALTVLAVLEENWDDWIFIEPLSL